MMLYIDPGTGSMLFTVLIGLIGAGVYFVRMLIIKLRYMVGGGKVEPQSSRVPIAIYSDDKRYWNIFAPVCRELDRRGMEVLYLTASEDDPALQNPYPHVTAECIGKSNRSFARLNFLSADILLSTTPGLDVYQWKRSKETGFYVHLPHASSDITLYRMFGIDYYDAILVSGQYQADDIRKLEALRGLPEKELELVGIPYMDEMTKRYQDAGPVPDHSRTVLLAPSWGDSAIFHVYGAKILDKLLATGYHIIVRPHPQSFASEKELMDKLMTQYPDSDQLEWNRDTDNFEVLRRSDILISDFSGVIFDFALVYGKPVIYTDPNFDLGVYDAWWLKKPLWTTGALSRIGRQLTAQNMENLKELIDTCLTDSQYQAGLQAVKDETWAYPGEGAVRVADYLLQKHRNLTGKKGGKD